MPLLLTEHDLKQRQRLPFCYLCGQSFSQHDEVNRDHVPPSAIFAKLDRVQPLILPTHPKCNEANSVSDEQIGQLVSVLHKETLTKKDVARLDLSFHRVGGSNVPAGAVQNFPFGPIVFRWLRGFHAALYGEFLPVVGGYVHPPMPEGSPHEGFLPIARIVPEYVKTIKKNRVSHTTDRIVCRNGKCRYECVWSKSDDGAMNLCIFALDIYDWQQLGDTNHAPPRSCVGIYTPIHVPLSASHDTKLEFPFSNLKPLDAFAD